MTFNPVTKIKLRLNSAQRLEIVLYDVLGKYLGRIFEGSLSQGESQIEFDAGDLSSGIYYYSL